MGNLVTLTSSITRPANATQYTARDVMSAVTTNAHHTFTLPRTGTGWSGVIRSASLASSIEHATVWPDAELWLFHTDIAAVADNAAFAATDAELDTCIGVIKFNGTPTATDAGPYGAWYLTGAGIIHPIGGLALAFTAPTRSIYGQLVEASTYTPAASEVLTVRLVIENE